MWIEKDGAKEQLKSRFFEKLEKLAHWIARKAS